ncbi:zeta toxin family protein [Caballeronia sordidicola]|uniref:zeta toxin family protein n=1 Tax=Caballeronia sordidicola TaxID=196367 RepID=UPI0015B8D71E|nr:zeta toxin family protein [Caballeronia sordidicola]
MNPEQYRLSEADHEAIFKIYIEPQVFALATAVDRPVAVIFGGQPGAGKSRAVDDALDEFNVKGGAVQIIGDDLRGYHPAYAALLTTDDKTAAFYTDRDTGKWVEKCIARAKEQRSNVVIEGTMRSGDIVAATMADFRDAGYEIDARALAVNFRLSEQGILQRYENQKADRGTGRMTTAKAHQDAYDGMPHTIELVEREKLADRLTIYRRGGEAIYANELHIGQWKNPPLAKAALDAERDRRMTLQERRDYATGFDRLVELQSRPGRNATDAERETLSALREAAHNSLKAEVFRRFAGKDVLAVYPELAGAYEADAAITNRLQTYRGTPEQRAEIAAQGREFIASRIERGLAPPATSKVKTVSRDNDHDR